MQFRVATLSDVDAIVDVLLRLKRRSNYATIPHDVARAKQTIRRCISSPQGWAGVVDDGDAIVGALIGIADTFWWGPRRFVNDLAYVSLKPGAAELLLTAFEEWGWRQPGVVRVQIGQSSGIRVDDTCAWFAARGYEMSGGVFERSIYEAQKVAI